MFLSLLFFLVSFFYILTVVVVLPVAMITSALFQLLKSSINIFLNKVGVMRFKKYIVKKKLQSACACVKSKNAGVSELFLRLVCNDSIEYYQTRAHDLHKAIALMYKQFDRNVHGTKRCEVQACKGCKHCSSATKTLLFDLKIQTG